MVYALSLTNGPERVTSAVVVALRMKDRTKAGFGAGNGRRNGIDKNDILTSR